MIELRKVKGKKDLKRFIEFPNKLYKNDPYYVPPLSLDEMNNLDPQKNPAYEYCEAEMFLAYKDGVLVGRICALINHAYIKKWNRQAIRFTRFDVIDDIEVSKALLGKVEEIARENGLNEVIGPIGFCDLDRQGMLVEGFNELSMFITIYNHAYYAEHMEKLGYRKDADWCEKQITAPKTLDPKIERISQAMLKKLNLRVVQFKKKKDVKPYIPEIFRLVNDTYKDLYGVVPLTERQIDSYVAQYYPIINKDYLTLIVDKKDKLVGFGLCGPSFAKATQKNRGHLFPFGWIPFIKSIKKNDVIDLYLIAVEEQYQGKGVNAIILSSIIKKAIENGVKFAETGPELELNDKVQAQWKGFEVREHKRRRCYQKQI